MKKTGIILSIVGILVIILSSYLIYETMAYTIRQEEIDKQNDRVWTESFIGGAIGGIAGFVVGGPVGAAIGGAAGATAGGTGAVLTNEEELEQTHSDYSHWPLKIFFGSGIILLIVGVSLFLMSKKDSPIWIVKKIKQ